MKKSVKILSLLLLFVVLLSIFSCHRRYCRAMRPYRNDVKHGYAH